MPYAKGSLGMIVVPFARPRGTIGMHAGTGFIVKRMIKNTLGSQSRYSSGGVPRGDVYPQRGNKFRECVTQPRSAPWSRKTIISRGSVSPATRTLREIVDWVGHALVLTAVITPHRGPRSRTVIVLDTVGLKLPIGRTQGRQDFSLLFWSPSWRTHLGV